MAGGRPEYLPVLVAAVDAFLDPDSGSEQLQAASGSAFPVVIVNGPIGPQIRLNSGFGCLGPDPQRPAGASIGRALRLMQQNVGGARPGVGTMANYGGLRYTNVVFALDDVDIGAARGTGVHTDPHLAGTRVRHHKLGGLERSVRYRPLDADDHRAHRARPGAGGHVGAHMADCATRSSCNAAAARSTSLVKTDAPSRPIPSRARRITT